MLVEQHRRRAGRGRASCARVHRATQGNPLYVDSITHLLVAEERPAILATSGSGEPAWSVALPLPPSIRDATRIATHLPRRRVADDAARRRRNRAHVHACRCSAWWSAVHQDTLLDLPRRRRQPGDDPARAAAPPVRSRSSTSSSATRCTASSNRAGGRSCTGESARALEEVHAQRPRSAPRRTRPPLPAGDRARDATPAGPSSTPREPVSGRWPRPPTTRRRRTTGGRSTRSSSAGNQRSGPTLRPAPRPRRSADTQRRHHRRTGRSTTSRRPPSPASAGLERSSRRGGARLCRDHRLPLQRPARRDARRPARGSDRQPSRRAIRRCACACSPGLSVALYWSDLDGRRFELSEEAVAMARRLRDPATLALAIHSRRYAQWGPDNFEQRLADAAQCRTLAFEANELELAVSASRWRFTDLLEDGDVAAADRELDAHAELAQRLHQPFLLAYTTQFRALRAIMQGRFRDGEALADDARAASAARRQRRSPARSTGPRCSRCGGSAATTTSSTPSCARRCARRPRIRPTTSAMALIHAELGERGDGRGDGRAARRTRVPQVPPRHAVPARSRPPGARVRRRSARRRTPTRSYDLLRPYAGRVVVVGAPAQACWGPVDHYLGVLAALGGRPEWAADHFEAALAIGARLGAPALLAETRLEFGSCCSSRGRADRRDRAMALLTRRRRTAAALELRRMIDRLDAIADSAVALLGRWRPHPVRRRRRRRSSGRRVARCAATASSGQ